jgi:hypothetical protein
MKFTKTLLALIGIASASVANAQDYSAAARTFDGSGQFANRLYSDNAFTTLAPVQSIIWFVADTSNNGVPTNPFEGSVLGGDDVLIFQDVVDGTLIGSQAGRFSRNYAVVPSATREASIYVYLWNQTSGQTTPTTTGFSPVAGNTFGILNLGNVTEPAVGDALWYITQNISSAQYTVNAIPEPSTYLLSGLAVLGLVGYRRFKK